MSNPETPTVERIVQLHRFDLVPAGEYVRYSDYLTLQSEADTLRAENARLQHFADSIERLNAINRERAEQAEAALARLRAEKADINAAHAARLARGEQYCDLHGMYFGVRKSCPKCGTREP